MKLAFLNPVYAQPGPFACVYVDTSRDIDDPDQAIATRWRHLKQDLQAQGADQATTHALAQSVGTDRNLPGRHGQALFAAHGRLILAHELPVPPPRDIARHAMLPDTMPLALQHAPDIPYVAVKTHRIPEADREIPADDLEVETQVGHWPTTRVDGSRTLRRMPASQWHHTAARLGEELTDLADRGSAEVIVISGDPWTRGVLTHKLPKRLQDRIATVGGHELPAAPDRALLEDELTHLLQGRLNTHDHTRVERFLSRRAHGSGTAEGLEGVVDALRRGQGEALLINDSTDLDLTLWVGTAPQEIALSKEELNTYGIQSSWEEPADTALIRAAVGTSADLIVTTRAELRLADGVGALLRYTDTAP